jgi:hypothetical protein
MTCFELRCVKTLDKVACKADELLSVGKYYRLANKLESVKFSATVSERLNDVNRAVPIDLLKQAILK